MMERLQAAEESIKVYENIIEEERRLRKESSKSLKAEMKELDTVFKAEKKSIQEKVAVELESTLKAAVRERVATKKQLEDLAESKDQLQKEYDDLREMYEVMKATQKETEKVTKQSEQMIKELAEENAALKGEKNVVAKSNIDKAGAMEAAVKQYEEMKAAFIKLDDARYSLNRVMGPGGSMTENERKLYLRPDY